MAVDAESLPSPPMKPPVKFIYLESIRGLAALVVVCSHLDLAFFGTPENSVMPFAGAFSVRLFFLLSGFVLSVSYFQKENRLSLFSAASKRYPRLMLPAGTSVLLGWLVMECGGLRNHSAASIMGQPPGSWLNAEFTVHLTFFQALAQGVFGTFFHYDPVATLNTSLWTMSIELLGSYFVFSFLFIRSLSPYRSVLYILVSMLLLIAVQRIICMYLFDFLAGIALCDVFVARHKTDTLYVIPVSLALVIATTACIIGVWATSRCLRYPASAFRGATEITTLCSVAIVGAAAFSAPMQSLLEHRFVSFLGRISFPLYLLHIVLINSVGCACYLVFRSSGWPHLSAALATSGVSIATSLLAAWLGYYLIERTAIRASSVFAKWCLHLFSRSKRA